MPFADLAEWNEWQQQQWRARIQQRWRSDTNAAATARDAPPAANLILPEEEITLRVGYRQETPRIRGQFAISLTTTGLLVYRALDQHTEEVKVPVTELEGCNIQTGDFIEYYRRGVMHQIKFNRPLPNAHKWILAIHTLVEQITNKTDQ